MTITLYILEYLLRVTGYKCTLVVVGLGWNLFMFAKNTVRSYSVMTV